MLQASDAARRAQASALGGLEGTSIRYRNIRLKVDGGVATLELAAPARANAITPDTVHELRDALQRVASDDSARSLVFTAASNAQNVFSSGMTCEAVRVVLAESSVTQPPQLLHNLRIPTVAALFGRLSGAAIELALACDLRVGADDTTFVFSQVEEGTLLNWGGTQRLPRVVGIGRALDLMLVGEPVDAAQALSMGLITRLLPRAEMLPESRRIVDGWVAGPPFALAYLKEAVRQGSDLPLEHALRLEWDLAVLLETTSDRAEGIKAFLEKRPANFKGE